MEPQVFSFDGRIATLFLPEALSGTIVYSHLERDRASSVWARLPEPKPMLAAIGGADWENDLTPWPAKRAFKGGRAFGGQADSYLRVLTGTIIPAVEAALPAAPAVRTLAGYSLDGLFALYAAWQTVSFSRVASVSGSLWYDGFLDFLRSKPPLVLPKRVYFSLGSREKCASSPRLASVQNCTEAAVEYLRSLGSDVTWELNPGGHFDDAALRLSRGIAALAAPETSAPF